MVGGLVIGTIGLGLVGFGAGELGVGGATLLVGAHTINTGLLMSITAGGLVTGIGISTLVEACTGSNPLRETWRSGGRQGLKE